MDFLARHVTSGLLTTLSDTPVGLLHGARQSGKSTLARHLALDAYPASYVTLDDAGTLAAAEGDPQGFLDAYVDSVIIDEVQRAPRLLLAIKASVDRDRRPGRFLLTGSAHVLQVPHLSETLAGRMEIHTLWPLSQGELAGTRETFLQRLFGGDLTFDQAHVLSTSDLVSRAVRGGFPEAVARGSAARRAEWFNAYVTTVLQREVRELADIESRVALPTLLTLLAGRVGGLANYADLGRVSRIPKTSLVRYLALLETTFVVVRLPAWSGNLGTRVGKAPKFYLADPGLLAALLNIASPEDAVRAGNVGRLLENLVVMELTKQSSWLPSRPQLYHYRTYDGAEVDIVLEARGGEVVGVEVKAGATLDRRDFRGLRGLAEAVGDRFRAGVILYSGGDTVPFGPGLRALPMATLWA